MIFGHFSFPKFGIQGAALATVAAFASITLMYIGVMLWMYRRGPYCLWSGRRYDHKLFLRLVKFGCPSGLQQFLDIAWVFNAAIRGAGDTRFALVFSFSMGLVLPTYLASRLGTAGFEVAWYAVTVFITVLGLDFMARFHQGRWMSMCVIEHTAASTDGLALPPELDQPCSAC